MKTLFIFIVLLLSTDAFAGKEKKSEVLQTISFEKKELLYQTLENCQIFDNGLACESRAEITNEQSIPSIPFFISSGHKIVNGKIIAELDPVVFPYSCNDQCRKEKQKERDNYLKFISGLEGVDQFDYSKDLICILSKNETKCWDNVKYKPFLPSVLKKFKKVVQIYIPFRWAGPNICVVDQEKGVFCIDGKGRETKLVDSRLPIKVSFGSNHTCILDADDGRCWGENGSGQADVPQDIARDIIQLVPTANNTCALYYAQLGSQVRCWGENPHLSIGRKDLNNPQFIAGSYYGDVVCAADGARVKCWGELTNFNGEGSKAVFDQIDKKSFKNITQLSVGDFEICVVDSFGRECFKWESRILQTTERKLLIQNDRFPDEKCLSVGPHQSCYSDSGNTFRMSWPANDELPTQMTMGSHHICYVQSKKIICNGPKRHEVLETAIDPQNLKVKDGLLYFTDQGKDYVWGWIANSNRYNSEVYSSELKIHSSGTPFCRIEYRDSIDMICNYKNKDTLNPKIFLSYGRIEIPVSTDQFHKTLTILSKQSTPALSYIFKSLQPYAEKNESSRALLFKLLAPAVLRLDSTNLASHFIPEYRKQLSNITLNEGPSDDLTRSYVILVGLNLAKSLSPKNNSSEFKDLIELSEKVIKGKSKFSELILSLQQSSNLFKNLHSSSRHSYVVEMLASASGVNL